MKKRNAVFTGKTLSHETQMNIRFSEVDSMGIVWHGHYVQYLEYARESFGHAFDINYMKVKDHGFTIPVTSLEIQYLKSIYYEDKITIKTTYIDTISAKIVFGYEIYRNDISDLICRAETTQVFLDTDGNMQLTCPTFFLDWKKKMGIL